MATPFSEEQIKKLNALAQLPADAQREQLAAFLKTLNQEQIQFLQQQQTLQSGDTKTNCPFCLISQKKMQSAVLYEDEQVMAVLDIRPATKGHTLLFPKEHHVDWPSLPAALNTALFSVAQRVSKALEGTLHCEGTNLFLANGSLAGQTVEHVIVHVIPRYKDDGLSFAWESKQANPEELRLLQQELLPHFPLEKQEKQEEAKSTPAEEWQEEEEPFADF